MQKCDVLVRKCKCASSTFTQHSQICTWCPGTAQSMIVQMCEVQRCLDLHPVKFGLCSSKFADREFDAQAYSHFRTSTSQKCDVRGTLLPTKMLGGILPTGCLVVYPCQDAWWRIPCQDAWWRITHKDAWLSIALQDALWRYCPPGCLVE